MNRKSAELTIGVIVGVLIALVVLILILLYIFSSAGGPKALIDSLLGFMGNQTSFVEATTSNI